VTRGAGDQRRGARTSGGDLPGGVIYVAHVSETPTAPEKREGRSDAAGSPRPAVRRPRLLVLTPDFPPERGGIQVLVHGLLMGLRRFQTRVVTLDSPGADVYDADNDLSVRRVSADRRMRAGRNIPLNAVALREAASLRPELVLSAHIVTSPAAATIRRVFGARTVQYFHANEIGNKPRLAAYAARHADASIAVSSYTASLLAGVGVAPAAITLIPPGVDLPSDPGSLPAEHPTVVTVARLAARYKGHDVLLGALVRIRERVPDVQWVVIGDGPLRPELEALARSLGVADRVRFLRSVSDEERNAWLRRATVFAMPSRLPGGGLAGEGFGIAYLEAGAYGKPVVAGNVGGAVDAVLDGVTGLLVDPTDAVALADAITQLLLDRELARRLGEAGAVRARELSWPVIAGRLEAVLFELLARAR
jgi:phosphatidyl-myo-inositol dimannoside synthase